MRLKLKLITATILWTIAITLAVCFSIWSTHVLVVWAIVSAAAAAVTSAMLAGDYIAGEAAQYIVGRIASERDRTVDRAARQMQQADKVREDRIVSRVQSANEAALRRVAGEIARAMREEQPTPLR